MVVIPGPVSFDMGSPATETERIGGPTGPTEMLHKKTIGRSFAIAAKEVTITEFRKFRENHSYQKQHSPTEDCPVNEVSWHEVAGYCNWLSKQEGLAECYEIDPKGQVTKFSRSNSKHTPPTS